MRGKEASGKAREARLSLSVDLDEEAYSSGAADDFPTDTKELSHRMRPTLKTAEWRGKTCFLTMLLNLCISHLGSLLYRWMASHMSVLISFMIIG